MTCSVSRCVNCDELDNVAAPTAEVPYAVLLLASQCLEVQWEHQAVFGNNSSSGLGSCDRCGSRKVQRRYLPPHPATATSTPGSLHLPGSTLFKRAHRTGSS